MDSPSFNQNSSNSLADIADRVVQELQIENRLSNDQDIFSFIDNNDEQEFEFPLFGVDLNSLETSTTNMMYDELISPKYPLFDQTLLQGTYINSSNNVIKSETESLTSAPAPASTSAPAPAPAPAPASVLAQTSALATGSTSGRLSLMKLFIKDCNNSASSSSSSSDEDDLDLLSPESYCVWEPKKLETTPRGKHKKSNSISIEVGNTSKKWNVRDVLFKRSYSDDNYTVNTTPVVLCLPPILPKVTKKNNEKVSPTKSEKNSKVGSNNKPENKVLRPAYKGKIGNIRLPAYLPYRHEQIGVYGNGSNNNMHWYVEGDVKQITDVNFDGMTFNDLREIVKRLVHDLVKRLYYCKVRLPLKSIKELKSDSGFDAFLLLSYENRMCVDLYVKHHNYDVLDFLLEETSDPEIVSASSDEYCSDDESRDIDGVDFHTEGDHNVVIKNFTTTNHFLNQLCSNGSSFRGFINDPTPFNRGNVEEDPDGSQIDPHYKIKKGNHPPLPPIIRKMPERPRKNMIKAHFKNNSQVSRIGRMMTCSNCLEVGHNKKTCDKDLVPKTLKPRKPPGRKSQTESVVYASSRGRGRGSRGGGRGARGTVRGGTGRGRVGQVDEVELKNALDHEYMEQLILEDEEKRMARDKEEQRQWDFDNGYLNPKNFIVSEDEMDVDAINMTPRPINLNVNTQESVAVHTASGVVEPPVREGVHNDSDVVEPVVAEGLDQEEIIDKVVIVEGVLVASNTRGRNKGKKIATETAPALPFRIYHKNKGR
uniref:PB1-like domain-containing protein n=1 Tax=Tanacetum cinerariifolium TaxID=118510 RepID=A0A6L2MJJ1_TANCI|nr:hypothetical protein [Tanacetum cinerariifolium]